jgi:hypothetical protein
LYITGAVVAIGAAGSSGVHIKNVAIEDMSIRYSGTGYAGHAIYMNYAENYRISACVMKSPNGIYLENVYNGLTVNNVITNGSSLTGIGGGGEVLYGIGIVMDATSYGNIISSNVIDGIPAAFDDQIATGIIVNDIYSIQSCMIVNNRVSNISAATAGTVYGIYVAGGNRVTVSSNQIYNCNVGVSAGSVVCGLYIATGVTSASLTNNYTYANGRDTGLANTNGDNFTDLGTDTQWAG